MAGRLAMGAQIRGTQVGQLFSGGKVQKAEDIQREMEQVAAENARKGTAENWKRPAGELAGVYSGRSRRHTRSGRRNKTCWTPANT